jgi:hypothetical protein
MIQSVSSRLFVVEQQYSWDGLFVGTISFPAQGRQTIHPSKY